MSEYKSERDAAAGKQECPDLDQLNNRFYSPFQGMTEIYALQKGVEHGQVIGFKRGWDQALTSSVVKGLVEAVRFEVRKYGDACPELQEALKAYESAVAQVKGET